MLAERYLERIIGRMIDINYHLITESGHPPPTDYYQSFIELTALGVLDQDFARRMASSAGLRNRLVHEYNEIDPRKIYEAVQQSLQDLPEFLRSVHEYADRFRSRSV